MAPAAGRLSQSEKAPSITAAFTGTGVLTPQQKDKVIEWYRGEFAAANAIIDALCHHLAQISAEESDVSADYDNVFTAIHRRRLNWIPVLQMQKYFTIADVTHELRKVKVVRREKVEDVVAKKKEMEINGTVVRDDHDDVANDGKCNGNAENGNIENGNGNGNGCVVSEGEDSPDSEITDTGK